jgi:hypothetical protein
MTTYATITVGYNVFLLPAKEAQAVFEALTGRGMEIDYFNAEECAAAGTTRGRGMSPSDIRVQCELLSVDDMHAQLERTAAIKAHKEAQEIQRLADADDGFERDDTMTIYKVNS